MTIRSLLMPLVALAGFTTSAICYGEKPSGATGECKDGSFTTAASKRGSCSGHGGLQAWYADKAPTGERSARPQAKAEQPSDSTGLCRDGSYTSADNRQGACAGHGGLKDWYGDKTPAARSEQSTKPNATSDAGGAKTSSRDSPAAAGGSTTRAQGGAGKVWVNSSTKVYHCSGDRWYGKTEHGAYMTEAEAKAEGNRPDHGKPCS
jgi:Protein of unknown function (DUF3761)